MSIRDFRCGFEFGNYEVTKFLSDGAYGRVFQCSVRNSSEKVAVKVQNISMYTDVIQNELEILKKVKNSESCVNLIENFIFGPFCIFVLEELGYSLEKHYHYASGRISVKNTLKIGCQLIDALKFLKSKSIVHRDIHANNILLDKSVTRLVLVDFGISNIIGQTPLDCNVHLSRHVSPEVNQGNEYKYYDDIVSVAFIFLAIRGQYQLYFTHHSNRMVQKKTAFLTQENFSEVLREWNGFLEGFFKELQNQKETGENYESLKEILLAAKPEFVETERFTVKDYVGNMILATD